MIPKGGRTLGGINTTRWLAVLRYAVMGGFLAITAQADLRVYEPFDYAVGADVDTPLDGAVGFAGAWLRAEEGADDTIMVTNGAPGTGYLDGEFNNPAVTTTPPGSSNAYIDNAPGDDRITASRVLRQSAGALAGDDKVLWASILWTMDGSDYGRQVGFVLGTDGLRNRSQNISISPTWGGSGDGDAMGVGGAISSRQVTPCIWDAGNAVTRTTIDAKSLSTIEDNIVILKYVFADGTNADTVYAWGFSESDVITEAAFDANAISAQAVVDQETLNIVSFGQTAHSATTAVETVDEIRIGDTFQDVTSNTTAVESALCVLWLDAGKGVETNTTGAVTNWVDQSGNGRDVWQTNDTLRPIYQENALGTNPVIRFATSYLERADSLGFVGNPGMTVFIVAKATVGGIGRMLEFGGVAQGGDIIAFSSDSSFRYNNGTETFTNDPVSGKFRIATYVVPGDGTYSDTRFFLNGYEATATSAPNSTEMNLLNSHCRVGSGLKYNSGGAVNNPFGGDMAEIIVYDGELSADDQDQIGKYLAKKYWITSRYFSPGTVLIVR